MQEKSTTNYKAKNNKKGLVTRTRKALASCQRSITLIKMQRAYMFKHKVDTYLRRAGYT